MSRCVLLILDQKTEHVEFARELLKTVRAAGIPFRSVKGADNFGPPGSGKTHAYGRQCFEAFDRFKPHSEGNNDE